MTRRAQQAVPLCVHSEPWNRKLLTLLTLCPIAQFTTAVTPMKYVNLTGVTMTYASGGNMVSAVAAVGTYSGLQGWDVSQLATCPGSRPGLDPAPPLTGSCVTVGAPQTWTAGGTLVTIPVSVTITVIAGPPRSVSLSLSAKVGQEAARESTWQCMHQSAHASI